MSDIKLTVPFSQVIRIGVAEKTRGVPRPKRARTTCITEQRKILKAPSILNDTEYYKDMYIKGALYRIQILCRRYTFWSYPAGLTIADTPASFLFGVHAWLVMTFK